jgi:signal transduction histidine kinase
LKDGLFDEMKRSHPSRSASALSLLPGASPRQGGYSEEEILEKAVKAANGRGGVEFGLFITFDPEQPGPLWIASGSPLNARRAAKRILTNAPLLNQLRKKRKPYFWADPKTPSILIPLSRKRAPFGVVCFILKRRNRDRTDLSAAAEIAWQAGAAIQSLRQLREKERTLVRWDRFRRIVGEISAERRPRPLLRKIVRRGIAFFGFDAGELALWDPAQSRFIVQAAVNIPTGSEGAVFRMGEGIGGMAAWMGRTMILHRERPALSPVHGAPTQPCQVKVATPLRIGERTLGSLSLQAESSKKCISDQDRFFLEALADQAAIAVENASTLDSSRKDLVDSEMLRKSGIELSAGLDRSELLESILHRGMSLSGLDVGCLALWESEQGCLRVERGVQVPPGFVGKKIKIGEGLVGKAVQERKTLSLDPGLHGGEPPCETARQLSLESAVAAPLIWKKKIVAALCFGTRDPGRRLSQREREIVEAFSQHAAAALANLSLFESLRSEREQCQKNLEEQMEELNLLQQEQARKEKLAALGQIVGSVNHELRQPLEVITNAAYYLKMQLERNDIGPIKKEFERFLTIISDECQSATDLVNELLDFTRKKEAISIRVDLNQLLENLIQRVQLPEKVRIKKRFSRKAPIVFIDPIQISRALNNFILNGIQAMTQGGTLEVATHLTRNSVEVVVHDTGEGIAPENMRRIFEPLFTTKACGVGLGLPLAKQYIEANHGEINVESRVGVGTTFRVSFPRLQAA